MNTINVENKGTHLTVRVNNGAHRRVSCFDIMKWRARFPGCTIIIDGEVNHFGEWA